MEQGKSKPFQFKTMSSGLGFHTLPDLTPPKKPITHQPTHLHTHSATKAGAVQFNTKAMLKDQAIALERHKILPTSAWTKWRRIMLKSAAFCLDLAIFASVLIFIELKPTHSLDWLWLAVGFLSLLQIMEVSTKTTLGKRIMGLSIRASRFRILLRSLLAWMSFGCFGVGILWAIGDPEGDCFHDSLLEARVQ